MKKKPKKVSHPRRKEQVPRRAKGPPPPVYSATIVSVPASVVILKQLRDFELDPLEILKQAAAGESAFRRVRSDEDLLQFLAQDMELALSSPSVQKRLFQNRLRSEPLTKKHTVRDQIGDVFAGRYPSIYLPHKNRMRWWRAGKLEEALRLKEHLRVVHRAMPHFDRQRQMLSWYESNISISDRPLPWGGSGCAAKYLIPALAHYRTKCHKTKMKYLLMAAGIIAGLAPDNLRGARLALDSFKKASDLPRNTGKTL